VPQGLRTGDELPPELRHAMWNAKVLGSALARQAYDAGLAGPAAPAAEAPVHLGLGGRLCRQADIEAPWLRHWCGRLGMVPLYHRKVWEECFIPQALWEQGMLAPGRRGLGFAVGRERLPALFAAMGAAVVATDLPAGDPRAREWRDTAQHADGAEGLFDPRILPREAFDARVTFRPADMAAIAPDLRGFDFLWSNCAFEHLGTLEAGLDFVRRAMACLRPGGVAVHTTEFNLAEHGPTASRGPTVLYQRRHIEALGERLAAAGHRLLPVDYAPGEGVLDRFVDLPPFSKPDGTLPMPDVPHLKKSAREHVATSIGLIVVAGG
jgi:SAM-dependent methyltransferase